MKQLFKKNIPYEKQFTSFHILYYLRTGLTFKFFKNYFFNWKLREQNCRLETGPWKASKHKLITQIINNRIEVKETTLFENSTLIC